MMQKANRPQKLDLPKSVLVGDQFKVRADSVARIEQACKLAGYDVNLVGTFRAISLDSYGPGGRERIKTDQAPWYFYQSDIVPAWGTDAERYRALSVAG